MDDKFKKTALFLTLMAGLSVAAGFFAGDLAIPSSVFRNLFTSTVSQENIISLTNESRTNAGLKKFRPSAELESAATKKAEDMLKNQYFAHIGSAGKTPWEFMKNAGYEYLFAGENLAIGFDSSEGVTQAWLASKEHKENILDPQFSEIGIGIARGKIDNAQATVVVQMFGAPLKKTQKISPLSSLQKRFRKLTLNFPSVFDLLKKLKTSSLEANVQNFQSLYLVPETRTPVKDILNFIALFFGAAALGLIALRKKI